MNIISCGFLVKSKLGYLALAGYGKNPQKDGMDIPKGCIDGEETHLDCAIRELKEETGIELSEQDIERVQDLGMHKYRKGKDIHLFYIELNDIDENFIFKCESMFESNYSWSKGEIVPEVVGYQWVNNPMVYFKSLIPILTNYIK